MKFDNFYNSDILNTYRLETWNEDSKVWETNLTFAHDRITWEKWLSIRDAFKINNKRFRLIGHYVHE